MFTCRGPAAIKNQKMNLNELRKDLEDLGIALMIIRTIIGSLRQVHNDTFPSVYLFGNYNFMGGITIRGIREDQGDIGLTNFLCGRWSVNWKEV